VILFVGSASAMVGGPVFVVPQNMTSMNVEGGQVTSDFNGSTGANADSRLNSQRVGLTARYGLAPGIDIGAAVGSANLTFSELGGGYGDYAAGWSLAWGGNLHAGWPAADAPYQIVGSLSYFGFQPGGKTTNGLKTISTKYLWHEVAPAVVGGYRFGNVIPYLGLMKPFMFGTKSVDVTFNGQAYAAAGGNSNFTDSEQALRGLLGLEWELPEGYSVSAESALTADGRWTLMLGLAQVLR
jgi:hypothetical protein